MNKLKTEEAQLHKIIDSSPDGILILDSRSRVKMFNAAFSRLSALKIEGISNQGIQKISDNFTKTSFLSGIVSAIKGTGSICQDLVELNQEKYSASFTPYKFEDGEDFGCMITLRKHFKETTTGIDQSEAPLENSFQKMTYSLPGVIYEYEEKANKGYFRYISEGCREMFGFEPHEVLHDSSLLSKIIHPDDLQDFIETSRASVQHRLDWQWEGRFIVNEKEKWIEAKSSPVYHRDGAITRYGMLLDITEKKQVEQQLRHNERLFSQLFANSPLGIVLLNTAYKVEKVNPGFEKLFGFSGNDIMGRSLNEFLIPENYQQQSSELNEWAAGGHVAFSESFRLNSKGEEVPVLIYGVPVTLEHQTIGVYGIYVNIKERQKAEEELQIRNAELDNFVYKVSHDLRAPLSSILGLINIANHEQNEEGARAYLGLIKDRINQLDSFINDVLSHSKNLNLDVEVSKIDFKSIIDKCFEELNYLPRAKSLERIIDIDNKEFYSDSWRLNEVFRNLISNSIKYINPRTENPRISIGITIKSNEAIILFEDNGIGISPSNLPKVFDMFYRATDYSEGSGIGLYIVKNAIEKLGGITEIQSKVGQGTTFEISLPNLIENS